MNQKVSVFVLHVFSSHQRDSSEPVYFVKVEANRICEEIMTDTYYAHTLNWTEKYFRGKYIYRRYDQGRQIKSSSS